MTKTNQWLEVDIAGLRKTYQRKTKVSALHELIQNAWDEDASRVDVTLTPPNKQGKSTLTCRDDSPGGYADLSHAHTMFAESNKKGDATKRGRFNCGDKFVISLCDEAQVTSTSGQVIFQKNGQRKTGTQKTKKGSEFKGVLDLTKQEFDQVTRDIFMVIPPIMTNYNGAAIPSRKPLRTFKANLVTELADKNNILRPRQRNTEIRIFEAKEGETPMLYERGLPVVATDIDWHVDIAQKVPLSVERDNVTPSYLKAVCVLVANEMLGLITEKNATKPWVRSALEHPQISKEATNAILDARFGKKRNSYDPNDIGSNREAVAKGKTVVHGGSMSKEEWANVKKHDAIVPAGKDHPTNYHAGKPKETIPPTNYNNDQGLFVKLIETVSPLLIDHTVTVRIIRDRSHDYIGCTHWAKRPSYSQSTWPTTIRRTGRPTTNSSFTNLPITRCKVTITCTASTTRRSQNWAQS